MKRESEEIKHILMECLMTVLLMAMTGVFCLAAILYHDQILNFFRTLLNG